ncbi:MAG: hypothetical protein JXB45_07340 [Candidatus Krumholzibacteriota bacterium]|nr:hypothetical protein [Candidatus Krumholzibacteriota bacterium]
MNLDIKKIIVDEKACDDPVSLRVRRSLPRVPVEMVPSARELILQEPARKNSLILMRRRGEFVKDFPVTPGAPPASERYLLTMLNCPFACTYCYLQSYLQHRRLVIFTDMDKMKEGIAHSLSRERAARYTTGEMGDSLALDHITGTTAELLPLFKDTGSLLEVRTKSSRIDHLLDIDTADLLVTLTLAPESAVLAEERLTASLDQRMETIKKLSHARVRMGIRFDPIVPYYAGANQYDILVERVIEATGGRPPYRFELGILRFPPGLWEQVAGSRPRSPLLRGEYIRDNEGKIRLYRPERIRLYKKILSSIHSRFPGFPVELSMEHHSVWEDSGCKVPFSPPRS